MKFSCLKRSVAHSPSFNLRSAHNLAKQNTLKACIHWRRNPTDLQLRSTSPYRNYEEFA